MPLLRDLLMDLGYTNVTTYLQSGNAVFRVARRTPARLEREIGDALARSLGFEVPVLVRSRSEIAHLIERNPLVRLGREGARLQITFLEKRPDPAAVKDLRPVDHTPDEFSLGEREVYLWCPNGVLASRLPMELWDKRFGLTTTRNWNTILALGELFGL